MSAVSTAMQANDLDRDTLRRLAEAKAANGGKAISFYLNLEPAEFATPPARAVSRKLAAEELTRAFEVGAKPAIGMAGLYLLELLLTLVEQ